MALPEPNTVASVIQKDPIFTILAFTFYYVLIYGIILSLDLLKFREEENRNYIWIYSLLALTIALFATISTVLTKFIFLGDTTRELPLIPAFVLTAVIIVFISAAFNIAVSMFPIDETYLVVRVSKGVAYFIVVSLSIIITIIAIFLGKNPLELLVEEPYRGYLYALIKGVLQGIFTLPVLFYPALLVIAFLADVVLDREFVNRISNMLGQQQLGWYKWLVIALFIIGLIIVFIPIIYNIWGGVGTPQPPSVDWQVVIALIICIIVAVIVAWTTTKPAPQSGGGGGRRQGGGGGGNTQ